jgi:hypothetical protein
VGIEVPGYHSKSVCGIPWVEREIDARRPTGPPPMIITDILRAGGGFSVRGRGGRGRGGIKREGGREGISVGVI